MGTVAAIVSIGAAVAGAVEGDKARRAQRQANDQRAAAQRNEARIRQRQADIKARQSRIRAIREQRISQAGITQAGSNAGATGSSAIAGGSGSVGTRTAANLSTANQITTLSREATIFNIESSRRAQAFSNEASAASGRAEIANSISGAASIFK